MADALWGPSGYLVVEHEPVKTMVRVTTDGLVQIDWVVVEEFARLPMDDSMSGWARMLLAVRDGTWEDLQPKESMT